MTQQELTSELHNRALDLGKCFHRICVENAIPYYMLGGSMLGAVRHKGFIPWDDDMDFGVEREYFDKLIEILNKQLPEIYRIISKDNVKGFYGGFIKIEDARTLVKERLTDFKYGVSIDVFPLDRTNNDFSFFSKNKIINTLYKLQNYRFYWLKEYSFPKRLISLFLHIIHFPCNKHFIYRIINKHLLTNNGDYIANHYGAWGMKETVAVKTMGEPTLYNFEDTQFYGVENYDDYLISLYGNNYMQLPPEDKRLIHITEIKVLSSYN